MRDGDGPVRDEERGIRGLPGENTGSRGGKPAEGRAVPAEPTRAPGAGIPEQQARPHPEDDSFADGTPTDDSSAVDAAADASQRAEAVGKDEREALSGRDGETGVPPGGGWGRAGYMSEHVHEAEQGAQRAPHIQHDPQDRSGARVMFVELRKLPEGSPEYAELRNQLVRMHLPLVEHLARRFRNRGEPLDDLTQVATIGLIKSVDRFDPERGVEFSTYATPTVVGEIKRHFRDKGWAVRVPRRLQELRLSLTTATAELSQLHGRSPTVHELAEKLAISEEEVLEGLESANAYSTLSLDVPDTDDESPAVADTLGAEDEALEGVEYRESLKPLLEDLPPREKRILLLRFFGNMTQSQIAQEVGISQMHVSRLLARTLAQLREKLLVEE
ncbi:RNA polymerase sigma factor SigF [Streptomyces sp. PSKA54]|uniref:RNA polymerase sigma factor SigF n=1 Tax=Streptomyces himalayensis subsp. aureolus TaxID=2758039 RepID=A0A7W2D677_9ACTN|nr:RNA polymerase sigma factor SigF [Streptomyces himalayensis]MBA4865497.1 RNA polymerase sigma factor SigF [Streptomyces himalayensis subsp. aureolus]